MQTNSKPAYVDPQERLLVPHLVIASALVALGHPVSASISTRGGWTTSSSQPTKEIRQ